MKRVSVPVLFGVVALLVSGCGADTGPLETRYELSGDAGVTVRPVLTVNDENGKPQESAQDESALPWSMLLVAERGATVLRATPSKGALTCRIVVEGREVAKVTGAPGQPVTCNAEVQA